MGEITPFDFFRQEASNVDVVIRTEAMMKITIVVSLMGPENTREEMIPFLQTRVEDFDQVILAMGDRIGDLLPFIGGPTYASAMIEILEKLFGAEEISVRNAAIKSARTIISQLDASLVTQVSDYFEMFKRMSNEDAGESFYMRVSCCSMIADLYKVLDQTSRNSIREIYMRLVIDDVSMVRRAAALVFLGVTMEAETEVILDEYLQVIKSLATDEYETVKVIGTENLLPFLKILKSLNSKGSESAAIELLPIIKAAGLDLSWRIRRAISKDFGDFALLFPEEEITNEIFPLGVHLIQDNEPDVRTNCLTGMISFQSVVPSPLFINDLMVVALNLVEDPYLTARKLLAEMCIDIAAKAGPDSFSGPLKEIIMRLVVDDDHLVRLRILKKMPIIVRDIPTICTVLTGNIRLMFLDSNWRIRRELAVVMPGILLFMGQDYFSENYLEDFLSLLKDDVGDVRVACAEALPLMTTPTNAPWIHEKLFPAVKELSGDEYLLRLSMISALQGLLKVELPEKFTAEVLALIIAAAKDKVPNIRIRAAQALGVACKHTKEEISRTMVRPVLAALLADQDKDVQYFASVSMKI